ncbi:MAG: AMP-binding protein [Thermoproteota archaeon]|nr:AMP-binding protein [Thermoproteota archaeon]
MSNSSSNVLDCNLIEFMIQNNLDSLQNLLSRSVDDMEWYWRSVNDTLGIRWKKPFERVLDSSRGMQWCKWFVNGKCNIVDNVLQKNIEKHPSKPAFIFVDSNGVSKSVSYRDLNKHVDIFALSLKKLGVKKGDTVGIYLPMIMEAFVATYACSKIGAIHVPVFAGFGKKALQQRLVDSKSEFLVTCDYVKRRGKIISLVDQWNQVLDDTFVKKIILVERDNKHHDLRKNIGNRDKVFSFGKLVDDSTKDYESNGEGLISETMDSEDPLFILFTSGTTGRPKGTIQTHGSFAVFSGQQSSHLVDLKPTDLLFWYADIGWITGQTWVVYGSPIIGSTAVIFEDVLDYPDDLMWAKMIDRLGVSIFGAAPTAVRQFIQKDVQLERFEFKKLRVLVSTGEVLDKDTWFWIYKNIGKERCPIINLSGGTEAGGAILSMLPFLKSTPSSVGVPVPGFDVDIYDDNGNPVDNGYLVIKKPWPGMTRSLLNDRERYIQTYWVKFPGAWFHGDRVKVDDDCMWHVIGRADDVIKISGHRIDPGELEQILTTHPAVVECAAVGIPDKIQGESIAVFCVLRNPGAKYPITELYLSNIRIELERLLKSTIGRFALPRYICFVNDLPKTRTGKILRRLIRQKVLGTEIPDSDMLMVDNPGSLDYVVLTR